MTSPTQRRHEELVALLTEIRDRLPEPEGVNAVEDEPVDVTEEPPGLTALLRRALGDDTVNATVTDAPVDTEDPDDDPDEELAKVLHSRDDSMPFHWKYLPIMRMDDYRNMARAAREHIGHEAQMGNARLLADMRVRAEEAEAAMRAEVKDHDATRARAEEAEADLGGMTLQLDKVHRQAVANAESAFHRRARHAALRADVEEMRRGFGRGLWPDFKGVLARDTELGAR